MKLIQALLNQDVFSAILVITGIAVLIRQRHLQASIALLFFIAAYFSTQIPLVSGHLVTKPEKLVALSLVSLSLVMAYSTLDAKMPLVIAAVNEVILLAVNVVFLMIPIHEWFHWAIFCVINYISFAALLYNYWQRGRVGNRESSSLHNPFKTWMHARGRIVLHNKKASAMAKSK